MELLKKYLRPLLKAMSVSFLMKSLGALAVLLPYLLAYVIDTIVPTKDIQLIVIYGLIMIAVSIAGWIFDIKANRLASRVARDATIHIRHDLFEKTIRLSCRIFRQIWMNSSRNMKISV